MSQDQLVESITKAILEDPTITDATHIVVSARREGPLFKKKDVIVLEGSVPHEWEINKVKQIVERKVAGMTVENHLIAS